MLSPVFSPKLRRPANSGTKDSFDRFGDDLARLLLSYHTYDEKRNTFEIRSRHECVSKQFQRCIYDTITEIEVKFELFSRMIVQEVDRPHDEICHKLVDFIATKCPNIESVTFVREFDWLWEPIGYTESVLRAMNRFPRLQSVYFGLNYWVFESHFNQLLSPFGSMVTNTAIIEKIAFPYEQCFPRVCSLWTYGLEHMFAIEDNHLLSFNRLKEINMEWIEEKYDPQRYAQFIAFYGSRLTTLNVNIYITSENSETKLTQFLAQLSEFTELKTLCITFFECLFPLHYSLYNSLKRIGLKCVKLKKFSLRFGSPLTPALIVDVMNSIGFISQLKRLSLEIEVKGENSVTDWSKLKPLNGWPRLTHLWIRYNGLPIEIITQVVSTQPILQALEIDYRHYRNNDIDNKWLKCVSELKSLQSLSVYSYRQVFRQSDIKRFIKKCPKLRSIKFDFQFIH